MVNPGVEADLALRSAFLGRQFLTKFTIKRKSDCMCFYFYQQPPQHAWLQEEVPLPRAEVFVFVELSIQSISQGQFEHY